LELAAYTIGVEGDFQEEDGDWAKLYGVGPKGQCWCVPTGTSPSGHRTALPTQAEYSDDALRENFLGS